MRECIIHWRISERERWRDFTGRLLIARGGKQPSEPEFNLPSLDPNWVSDEEFESYKRANPLGDAPSLAELERTSRAITLGGDAAQQKILTQEAERG